MTDSIFPAGAEPILPILPLRNSVLFPATVVPVNVGRARSVRLIEEACGRERPAIGVVTQHKPEVEDPTFDQVYHTGTIARVLKVIRLNSGQYSVVLQGVSRMRIEEALGRHPTMRARVHRYHEAPAVDVEIEALAAHLRESARQLLHELPTASRESLHILDNVREPGALADLIESNLPVSNESKQEVLETLDIRERVRKVLDQVNRQNEVLRVKHEISTIVEEEMSSSQREYLLRQQIKSIRRELGETDVDEDDVENLRERIALARLPSEAEAAAKRELRRMSNMNTASSEYQVAQTYVTWLADLPWTKMNADRLDVQQARRVLDEDHYGLEKPKRRIVEYIAVRKLRRDGRAPILCFVGPPGVGKTSLGRSIARASGRAFVRVSLGGVSDEAEVRGHRRTYVGAFPGRIISGLKKAGAKNPVMVLDEIDKLGSDQRGDPSSALLEVLDPEQNHQFTDHYIDAPFDLSKVMFIATANQKSTIPGSVARSHGSDRAARVHAAREAVDRSRLLDPASAQRARPVARASRLLGRVHRPDRRLVHARSGRPKARAASRSRMPCCRRARRERRGRVDHGRSALHRKRARRREGQAARAGAKPEGRRRDRPDMDPCRGRSAVRRGHPHAWHRQAPPHGQHG